MFNNFIEFVKEFAFICLLVDEIIENIIIEPTDIKFFLFRDRHNLSL